MQVDIYINEEKFDTDSKTVIAETKQVNDFFDIKDIQTSYTNSFKLPKTARNILLLGGMGIVGSSSLVPYRVHKISIKRNGIETISDGIGYFKPTDEYFNMYVYNDNINLFDAIGDKTLADLNLTSLNHNLNIENWISSFNREDYTYALADYGKIDNNEIEINYQVPSLFVKYLWNLIFNENGFKYKYSGRANQNNYNPFLTDEWNEIAITIDEGLQKQDEEVDAEKKLELFKDNITFLEADFFIDTFGRKIIIQELTGEHYEYVNFNPVYNPDNLLIKGSFFSNRTRIRIKESGFYKLNVFGNFYNLNLENASLFIEKDNVNLFTIKEDFVSGQSQIGFEEKLYLREGDELFVKIKALPLDNEIHYSYDLNLELTLDNSITYINFSSYLSKIKQKDFIKDVMQFYGLMSRKNADTYEFISFNELLDPLAIYNVEIESKDIYEDWSNKFHRVLEDDSKVGGYAKNNLFKYKYEDSEDTFADALLRIDDKTLESEVTLIQRIYRAPDNSTTILDSNILKKCTFYEKELNEDGSLKSVKTKKVDPYFFRVQKKETQVTYKLAGAVGGNTQTFNIPLMSFDGLDFNSTIPSRFSAFGNMINYGQKLTAEIYLSVLDIHNLDFFKLKYFKQLGNLYYLSKPIKFIDNGIIKVELIRIKSVEKLAEFSDDFNDDFNT
jgi:hypothetical protein